MTAQTNRIHFDPDQMTFEIDLTDLHLRTHADVANLYDDLELAAWRTGKKWFFLINYLNCKIDPEAWIAFAKRGKRLNLDYSLGTARYNTADEVGGEIERRADHEEFAANLTANRAAALRKIHEMRADYLSRHPAVKPIEPERLAEFDRRIQFDAPARVMDVDFSDFQFTDSRIVNGFYDLIERRIAATGHEKWWFLVNYRRCEVHPEAWIAFGMRGKRLNRAHSLGSVRYAANDATATEIADRAETEKFDANLFPSREAALGQITAWRVGNAPSDHRRQAV